jgi:hypothetical protein
MTQPAADSRHTVDSITSDALDQLYADLAKAKQDADDAIRAAAHLTTLVGKRSERAEKAAKKQALRAKLAETELRTLRAGLRANGADPTQIQNLWAQISLRNRQWRDEKQRAFKAETERDAWHDWADTLAYKVAPVEVIGRHDEEGRFPWSDALDLLTPAAEVDQLRQRAERAEAALAAVRALAERWQHTGDRKHGPLRELRAALDAHTA